MPTHKGKVMVDTVNGSLRVRQWPKPRGTPKSEVTRTNNKKFAQVQRAYNWLAPIQIQWLLEQAEGTPLMPRDILTAMLYNRLLNVELPSGRDLYPMPTRS